MKKNLKFLIPLMVMLIFPSAARAYDIVNLPESMSMSEALGIFNSSEITRATVSEPSGNTYIELTREEIEEFFDLAADMELYRTVNATPFRGTAVNFYTNSGVKSYYLTSGVQIGMYGTVTYMCYRAESEDAAALMYIDSAFKDEPTKLWGEYIHVNTDNDFLKMPRDKWAQTTIKDAASRCLVPYELTDKYNENITRAEFCGLLADAVAVTGNYASLEDYMRANGKVYFTNYFSDCGDKNVNMLHSLGIVNGKGEGLFDPDGIVTREEAAAFVCRTAELFMHIETDETLIYDDKNNISPWARYFVAWVTNNFIMNGTDGSFLPQNTYTVQEAITTVNRMYKVIMR